MNKTKHQSGFTLLEILVVISIMAVMIAMGLPVYQEYSDRARASEIIERFDALRTNVAANFGTGVV